jgi:hypothetical protein
MPEFEKYANESPEAARRRIAKNIRAKGNPGAPSVAPMAPRAPRTKGNLMGKGYNIARNINGGKLPDVGY